MNQGKPTITLKEALEQMERKLPIAKLVYRTGSLSKNTGGELKELTNIILQGQDWDNSTRTFLLLDEPEGNNIREVHIRLMLYINGRRIIY